MTTSHINEKLKQKLIDNGWWPFLSDYFSSSDWISLKESLELEYKKHTVFPEKNKLFKVLTTLHIAKIKIIILGQDPYFTKDCANGFAFGTDGMVRPPSLCNIIKEVEGQMKVSIDRNKNSLSGWVAQGVLLLNSVWTVRECMPYSHANIGWQKLTELIIKAISNSNKNCVFMLWGDKVKKFNKFIDINPHLILECGSPSPRTAYQFSGNRHFIDANKFLIEKGHDPIKWSLIDASDLNSSLNLPTWTEFDDRIDRLIEFGRL